VRQRRHARAHASWVGSCASVASPASPYAEGVTRPDGRARRRVGILGRVSRVRGQPVDERVVDLGGVSLFVRRSGSPGAAVLLALHGGPGWDHSYLLPAMDDLADVRHVVLVDLRGCGRSSRDLPDEAFQPEPCVQDAARLVGWLGAGRVDLLGFSYGGQLAMLFAERYPHLINRLVLASTTAYPDVAQYLADDDTFRGRTAAVADAVAANWADESADDAERTRRHAALSAPTYLWDLQLGDQWRAVLTKVRFSGCWNRNWRNGLLRPPRPADPERVLNTLARPTLILHGARDLCFPFQVARRLHAAVPHSELALVDDAGHAAHFEQRAEWVALLRTFLTGVTAAAVAPPGA
jgi:pimeloyl-ACP methyl ester carboxylesterase